ncbi:MAG: DegT/DnrJ/EryC1/StrS family aminotransferase [bacterium]|nr:DegT/DnrJ/EryC1/StrS family aminotransferase [bacterium]
MEDVKILLALLRVIIGRDYFFPTSKTIKNFETAFATLVSSAHAFGVSNGTDALIMALKACGIQAGDEVIVPASGFIATASCAAWIGARPVFVDIDFRTFNINPSLIENYITIKTKAIIVTHLNGRMADMDKISAIAKKHNLFLIEDAAQAVGSKYRGESAGHYGDMACFSFNPSKALAAYGDGGAVVTNNISLAEKISLMRTYGARFKEISAHHKIIGVASRLGALQAAILLIKLENISSVIEAWRHNYFLYFEALRGVGDLILPEVSDDFFINGYRFVVLTKKRNDLQQFLRKNGVNSHIQYGVSIPYFEAFSYLQHKRGEFPESERVAFESIVLPTAPIFRENDIYRAVALIKKFFANL